jgi:uncharacterized membrane protein SpoIIM required for sporulation
MRKRAIPAMVLESLIKPLNAEKKPYIMFFIGVLYSSLALLLSQWIFFDQASLVMIFLTVLASVPLIYNTLKLEEKKDVFIHKETVLLKEHGKALMYFMFLFMGFTVSFSLWYVFLPPATVQNLFSTQTQTYISINSNITGNAIVKLGIFTKILFNNLKVLLFCLLFSFLYGVGSIFILTWNASVLGVAIGNFIRTRLSEYATSAHLMQVAGYFHIFSLGLLRYAIHGIPEILSYFVGGLAGGIVSIAVIRHDFGTKNFEHIVMDSSDLLILSLVLLVVGAFLEVYVTPLVF